MKQSKRSHGTTRTGGTAFIAIVCLLLVGFFAAAVLKVVVARRDALGSERGRLQADWLVEAGLERAAARLANDPDYAGETWSIPPERLRGRSATVTIHVDTSEDHNELRSIEVRAETPADGERRAKRGKTFLIRPGAGFPGDPS